MIDQSWYIRPPDIPDRQTAGGVVALLDAQSILIAFARDRGRSEFILPKGKIERGESPESAARREILEEAGLDNLQLVTDLGTRERLSHDRAKWVTTRYFLFLAQNRGGQPLDRLRYEPAVWFPLDQLPPIYWPEQRELIETNRQRIKQEIRAI